MSIDGKDRSFAAFMADYVNHPNVKVIEVDVPRLSNESETTFIVLRYGRWTAVVSPMGLDKYLDVDVHAFVDGEDGALGVMGMNIGRRVSAFQEEDTPLRVDMGSGTEDGKGVPAVRMAALFIGDYSGEEED